MVEVARVRPRRLLRFFSAFVVISLVVASGAQVVRSAVQANAWPFDPSTVGARCSDSPVWVCGSIRVPLDRAKPGSATIRVQFRILPRRVVTEPSAGTIVVVNGGPGEPSMAQYGAAQRSFYPQLADHDLLLMDNRGTGASGRIDCPEADKSLTSAAVAQCRSILGARAGDYGTVAAVDDLDLVLAKVHAGHVDLYGESYGTFFAQVFALRHPQHLQRLVLDGALPLDVAPWRLDSISAGLTALRATCRATPTCRALGDPVALLRQVLARVRAPVPSRYISRHAADMAVLLANAGRRGSALRELPSALHAYLGGDHVPLFRLMRDAETGGAADASTAFADSEGLFLADYCTDEPQPFDLHASLVVQKHQYDVAYKAIAGPASRAVAPFTPREYLLDSALCLGWPAPTGVIPRSLGHDYPDVPTLVLEGGADTVTPATGARAVAAEFRHSRYVTVPFVGHVVAFQDQSGCAAGIAGTFLGTGAVDTACLKRQAAPRSLVGFSKTLAQEPPIEPIGQSVLAPSANDRRTVALVRDVVSDVMWRWIWLGQHSGQGLRGGTYSTSGPDSVGYFTAQLHAIRWTIDSTVTGSLTTHPLSDSLEGVLDVATPTGTTRFAIQVRDLVDPPVVESIMGTRGGLPVDVEVAANLDF